MTNTSNKLAAALNASEIGVRRSFMEFSDEQKQQAEEAFLRHRVACERSAMQIDPAFVRELVHDIKFGFFTAEEPLAMVAGLVM